MSKLRELTDSFKGNNKNTTFIFKISAKDAIGFALILLLDTLNAFSVSN